MKRTAIQISFITAIFLVFFAVWVLLYMDFTPPQVIDGSLDLEEASSVYWHSYSLHGEWGYYPSQITGPTGITGSVSERAAVPHLWSMLTPETGNTGVNTYEVIIRNFESDYEPALLIPPISSAYVLYVNGKELFRNGNIAFNKSVEESNGYSRVIKLPEYSRDFHILLQVSNHTQLAGGFLKGPPIFGSYNYLSTLKRLREYFSIFLATVLLVVGLVMVIRFTFSKANIGSVFFALFCVAVSLQTMIIETDLLLMLSPVLPGFFINRFELMLGAVGLGSFFLYVRYSLQARFLKGISLVFTIPLLLFCVAVFILPFDVVSILAFSLYVFRIIAGIFLLSRFYSALRLDWDESIFLFIGFIGFYLAQAADAIQRIGIFPAPHLLILGAVFYSLFQTHLFSRQTIRSFQKVQLLGSQVERMAAVRESFLTNTTHNLRNPLNGIIGLGESLLTDYKSNLNAEVRDSVSLIVSSGYRLAEQVGNLMDLSRLKQSELTLKESSVDLHSLIDLLISTERLYVEATQIDVINKIDPHLPPVQGDEQRLEQISASLVRLLVKHTREGAVEVHSSQEEGKVVIHFVSGNCELDADQITALLQAFDKGIVNTREVLSELDVTISVIESLLVLHKTSLTCESDGEERLKFSFVLTPSSESAELLVQSEDEDIKDALTHVDLLRKIENIDHEYSVMVVDDDPLSLQVMRNLLSALSYNVIPFLNGEDALARLMTNEIPDLILADALMPKMNGFELCRRIRNAYSATELPILILNFEGQTSSMMEGLAAGANDFLTKPFKQEEFLTRVKTNLELARINKINSQFVPNEIIQFLGHDSITTLKQGEQIDREITIFFIDIRKFTSLTEKMTAEESFKFINSYLSRINPLIVKHGGIIDKYVGDSIMALFPDDPDAAVLAGLEIMDHLFIYNQHRANSGYQPIQVGIGIHTGPCIMGIVGDRNRMQGTVISDAVNLASRVQDVTKLYGAGMIISQDTFVRLEDPTSYNYRFLGKVKVKGKANVSTLFEFFDGDAEDVKEQKSLTKNDFETAILLFSKRQFEEARPIFANIVDKSPNDKAAALFLDRIELLLRSEKHRYLMGD